MTHLRFGRLNLVDLAGSERYKLVLVILLWWIVHSNNIVTLIGKRAQGQKEIV